MKNAFKALMVASVIGLFGPGTAPAHAGTVCSGVTGNLVANCGFDNGPPTLGSAPPLSWDETSTVPAGSFSAIGGYDYSGSNAWAFATGSSDVDTISQTLTTTVGQTYMVSFYYSWQSVPGPTDSNGLSASWDGGPVQFSVTNVAAAGPLSNGYTLVQFTDVGTGSDTLSFSGYDTEDYMYLDEVSVAASTSTPEPASLLLLGAGLAGLGAVRRRRGTSKR